MKLGEPFPDTPNDGVITVNAELVPLASPKYEPGPPDENSIELARVVDRGIRESHASTLKNSALNQAKKSLLSSLTFTYLNHDGNLIDAAAIAAMAALLNTKMPNYEIQRRRTKNQTRLHSIANERATQSPLQQAKSTTILITDPWIEEEQVMDSRITMAINEDGNICAVQKGGSGYFTPQQILEATKIALEKAAELRKKLNW